MSQRVYSVVVVEDNTALLQQLLFSLPLMGPFAVTGASDGVAGLEKITQQLPDCAVIDVKMPGLDGYQLVRILRGDPTTRMIPLVIMTALAQDKDRFAGLASGADAFLTKPVLPQDLANTLLQVIHVTEEERLRNLDSLAALPSDEDE